MKTNELMINDKVFVKVLSQIPDTYVIHTWTAKDYLKDRLQIKPVPITEEILVKNGFEYSENDEGYFDEEGYIYIAIPKDSDGAEIRIGDGVNYIHLIPPYKEYLYAHELQHVLRLCGMTELADNFNV